MLRFIAAVLTALACAGCHASEETEKNATEFLATQKEVNTTLCRETRYRVLMGAVLLGSSTLKVEAAKFDDTPCYKVTWRINIRVGDNSFAGEQVNYISAGMVCLHAARNIHDSEEGDSAYVLTRTDKQYVSVKTDKAGNAKSVVFDEKERLVLEAAEDLVPMLLPLDKAATYDFLDHSGKWGYTGRTYEVVGPAGHGSLKGTLVKHLYYSADDKKNELHTNKNELLIDEKRGIVRLEHKRHGMILELDDGDNSPETYRQYARPIDPVFAFWHGLVNKDVELIAECMNEGRYFDEALDRDAKNSKMTEAERAAAKKLGKGKVPEAMVKNVQIAERERALFKSLNSDDFDLKYESSTRVKVKLNEHYRKRSGDQSEMFFIVELDDDSGKWKFVWIDTKDDEF